MIGRTEIGQQRAHLVEGMSTDGFVIASTGEIVADLLLMIPEKSMQRENVGVADGRHRIGRIDAGDCFSTGCCSSVGIKAVKFIGSLIARTKFVVRSNVERRTEIIVETTHVEFFREDEIVRDVLQDLRDECQAAFDARQRLGVDDTELVRKDQRRIEKAKKDHRGHGLKRMLRKALLNDLEQTRTKNCQLNGELS